MKKIKDFVCYKYNAVSLLNKDGNNVVRKKVQTRNKFWKEVYFLQTLKEWEHTPKLLGYNEKESLLYIQHVGNALTSMRVSDRLYYRKRIIAIVNELERKYHIYHNDLRWKNIVLSEDDKLYLIDWETGRISGNVERDDEYILLERQFRNRHETFKRVTGKTYKVKIYGEPNLITIKNL